MPNSTRTNPHRPLPPAPNTPHLSNTAPVAPTPSPASTRDPHRFERPAPSPTNPHTPPAHTPATPAERYMQPLDHGFWKDPQSTAPIGKINGYIDFAVQNYEYHKKMAVEVQVEREDGSTERYLYRPQYKGKLPDGREKWGVDPISIFPDIPGRSAVKEVRFSYKVQADVDHDGQRDLCVSHNFYKIADANALRTPSTQLGSPAPTAQNPEAIAPLADPSRIHNAAASLKDTVPPVEVYFAPYQHPERALIAEIDKVIQAKRLDPQSHHSIHASVFNINDPEIANKLIEAHQTGVEVKLLTAAHQMDPNKAYQLEYKRLQQAGVPVIGIARDEMFASNHTKFAIFDGHTVTTGSYNWESRSNDENNENMMILRSPAVAALYEDIFRGVAGEAQVDRSIQPLDKVNVLYSQQHNVPKAIYDEIEKAKDSITLSMFTLRSLQFEDAGQHKDILDALIRAQQRGVKVSILLEKNIADAGEYYGRLTENDPTDERLAQHGIEIVKIKTNFNNNPYAAMHHKFAVFDGQTTMTGAYNWYAGSQVSDDDLIVIRDTDIAQRYLGEVTNLRRHYDPDFDPSSVPHTQVAFSVQHPHTRPGDQVYLVGDIPELGGWDLDKGIRLNANDWPDWKVALDIPAGTHFEYKFVVKNPWSGRVWEAGANREHTANSNQPKDALFEHFRG
ncbi:phospholipase D-like domain-containing protein [Myxococcota bacterium]|nr:phospholipase D-like domain-containing protein [Myxococcota bacterium]